MKCRVSIAPLTTFRVGGRAAYYLRVKSADELVSALKEVKQTGRKCIILAGGSNIVFPDGLWPGVVIHFLAPATAANLSVNKSEITCGAGVLLSVLIKKAVDAGLGGLEGLSGIPGTVGGAIVGNAGAYGQEISDSLFAVEIFDGKQVRWLSKVRCQFKYRESIFKRRFWVVLRARFRLRARQRPANLKQVAGKIIRIRRKKYPPNLFCPGSFFKNILTKDLSRKSLRLIPKDKIIAGKIPSGYLLEKVGANGMRYGGLRVADYHGNLLINQDGASQQEVKKLANLLKTRVKRRFGIELVEEVRFI